MSYFTKITFASLFLFVSSLQASYDYEIVDIRAQGRGETREEAIAIAEQTIEKDFPYYNELSSDDPEIYDTSK